MTVYEAVGGEEFFITLVGRFYDAVEQDDLLRPMYPEKDLTQAKRRLHLFLMQYFGGPDIYSQERGHPRLRARHMPFPIGQAERDAWMTHMLSSLKQCEASEEIKIQLLDYFDQVASFMINRASDPIGPSD